MTVVFQQLAVMQKSLSVAFFLASMSAASAGYAAPYRHDGLYLAGAAGLGYLSTSMTFDGAAVDSGSLRIYGAAATGSVFVGGTLARGFALGGGLYVATAPSPKLRLTAPDIQQTSAANGALTLVMVGPFANFYPDPAAGFHVSAMVGFASVSLPSANASPSREPTGVGLLGSAGYDWWLGPELGLGVLGQFAYAAARKSSVNYPTLMPSLCIELTYN